MSLKPVTEKKVLPLGRTFEARSETIGNGTSATVFELDGFLVKVCHSMQLNQPVRIEFSKGKKSVTVQPTKSGNCEPVFKRYSSVKDDEVSEKFYFDEVPEELLEIALRVSKAASGSYVKFSALKSFTFEI